MARQQEVRLRLTAKGKKELIDSLQGMGREGKRAAEQIERSSRKASRGLKGIDTAARGAKAELNSFARRVPVVGEGLAAMGPAGLAAAAGIAALTVGLTAALRVARSAVSEFDKTAKAARDIGVSTDLFQSMQLLADEASISFDKVGRALRNFERNAARAATGRGELVEMLRATHPELLEEIANLETAEDRLERYRVALRTAETQQERNLLATAAFGESGFAVARMLAEQEESMADLIARAREMGLVIDQSVLQRAEVMETRLSVASRVIDTNLKQAFIDLAPVLVSAAELLGDVARGIKAVTDAGGPSGQIAIAADSEGLREQLAAIGEVTQALNEMIARGEDGALDHGRIFGPVRDILGSDRVGEIQDQVDTRLDMLIAYRDALRALGVEIDGAMRAAMDGEGDAPDQDLARQAELIQLVAAAREAARTPAEKLAEELEGLREAREAGLIATDAELERLEASARARAEDGNAAGERARLERQAAQVRAELGDVSGLLAIQEGRLNTLVEAGLITRAQATARLEQYADGLETTTEAAREAAQITESVRRPAEIYADRIARLNALLEAGEISQTVHARAVAAAREEYAASDPVLQTAARVREELRTNTERLREEQERVNEAVAAGEITQAQAEDYMERYRESLERAASAAGDLRFEHEVLDEILAGNVRSFEDLGRVALRVLSDIISSQIRAADSAQGFGAFIGQILRGTAGAIGIGSTPAGSSDGTQSGDSPVTGGPIFHRGTGAVSRASLSAAHRAARPKDPREHDVRVTEGERIMSAPDNARLIAMIETALSRPPGPVQIGEAGRVTVQIEDRRGERDGLEVSERRSGSDDQILQVAITDMVRGGILGGRFDKELDARFGLRPGLARR